MAWIHGLDAWPGSTDCIDLEEHAWHSWHSSMHGLYSGKNSLTQCIVTCCCADVRFRSHSTVMWCSIQPHGMRQKRKHPEISCIFTKNINILPWNIQQLRSLPGIAFSSSVAAGPAHTYHTILYTQRPCKCAVPACMHSQYTIYSTCGRMCAGGPFFHQRLPLAYCASWRTNAATQSPQANHAYGALMQVLVSSGISQPDNTCIPEYGE